MTTTSTSTPTSTPWHLPNGQTMEDINGAMGLRKILGGPSAGAWIPPAFTNPNYKPPNSYMPTFIFAFVCGVAGTAMVAFRIITTQRTRPTRLLYLEDWLILAGLLCLLALCALAIVGHFKWQFGWHSYDMHVRNLVWNYTFSYVWFVVNLWAAVLIRASLILTIRRIYSPLNTRLLRVCDILLLCKIIVAVGGTLGITFACGLNLGVINVYKFNRYTCNPFIGWTAVCACLLLLDLFIIVLPMPLVKMLANVARKRKVEVLAIFSLGFLAVGASVVRLLEVIHYFHTLDKNWIASYLILTSLLDLTLALVTSCIPSARILFHRLYSERSLFAINSYFTRLGSISGPASTNSAKRAGIVLKRTKKKKRKSKSGGCGGSQCIKSYLSKKSVGSTTLAGTATDTFMSSVYDNKGDKGETATEFEKFDFDLEDAAPPPRYGGKRMSSRGPPVSIPIGPKDRPPVAYMYEQRRQSLSSTVLPIGLSPSLAEDADFSITSVRNSSRINSGLGTTWFDDRDDEEAEAPPRTESAGDEDGLSSDEEDSAAGGGREQYYEGDREFLIPCPSDSFFPYATALRPPPPRRT